MIVIRSFKEMADLNRTGVVPFRIVQEIASVLLGLCGYTKEIPAATDIGQQEIYWLLALPQDISFMHYLGGNVYICECISDLQQVTSMDMEFSKLHGRWPNVTEVVLGWDEAKYLLNADGTADYALLFSCTNNAGGPSWFIPKQHFQAAQIDAQIRANNQYWSVAK